jgi:hypothetical protein
MGNSHIDLKSEGIKSIYLLIQGTAVKGAIPYITNVICHLCRRFHMK